MTAGETTSHRGVDWRRDEDGGVSFFDARRQIWVAWSPGIDAPPLPPSWSLLGVPTRVARPGWRSWRRILPVSLVLLAVVVAVVQVERPTGNAVAKEAASSAALLGKCLPQDGSALGHPKYSTKTVACDSNKAAVKVVLVLTTTPGSPTCPGGTNGVVIPYTGVRYPHIECIAPVGGK